MNRHEFRAQMFRAQQPNIEHEDFDKFDYSGKSMSYYELDQVYFRIITAPDKPFSQYVYLPNSGEISRLCAIPRADLTKAFKALSAMFRTNGLQYMCATLTPALLHRLETKYGVKFANHMEPVELYGQRVPVWDVAENVIRGFYDHIR